MSANAETVPAAAVENAAENAVEEVLAPASSPVEAITEAVKNTSISEGSGADLPKVDLPKVDLPKVDLPKADAKELSEADAAHALSAAEGRRLYIGNLAYSTTDEQLKAFFQGFPIESTSIPSNPRTGRAVGYAFVDLTTKEEADRAIEQLSGTEVLERKVSVQLARTPGSKGGGARRARGEPPAHDGDQPLQGKKRGGVGRRGRAARRARAERGDDYHTPGGDMMPSPPINVVDQLPLMESTNVKLEATTDAAGAGHHQTNGSAYRGKKRRGPPENGIPSLTKIMVANLPYELTEEKLKEYFTEYQPESAKIALRPIPRYMVHKLRVRGEPRKGRGFGFVNLASEEMQKKAVEEMNGKVIDGREIAVKVAIDSQASHMEDKENVGEEKAVEVQNGVQDEPEAIAAA